MHTKSNLLTFALQNGEERVFAFYIPTPMCGIFIGKKGRNIKQLKATSGAHIQVEAMPTTSDWHLCVVKGVLSLLLRFTEWLCMPCSRCALSLHETDLQINQPALTTATCIRIFNDLINRYSCRDQCSCDDSNKCNFWAVSSLGIGTYCHVIPSFRCCRVAQCRRRQPSAGKHPPIATHLVARTTFPTLQAIWRSMAPPQR